MYHEAEIAHGKRFPIDSGFTPLKIWNDVTILIIDNIKRKLRNPEKSVKTKSTSTACREGNKIGREWLISRWK